MIGHEISHSLRRLLQIMKQRRGRPYRLLVRRISSAYLILSLLMNGTAVQFHNKILQKHFGLLHGLLHYHSLLLVQRLLIGTRRGHHNGHLVLKDLILSRRLNGSVRL
jgi:hypothetical protein